MKHFCADEAYRIKADKSTQGFYSDFACFTFKLSQYNKVQYNKISVAISRLTTIQPAKMKQRWRNGCESLI